MDAAAFRQVLPEFKDQAVYPDPVIGFWLDLADKLLPLDRWCELHEQGMAFYVAHHLVLGKRDQEAVDVGGIQGEVKGPTTAMSVDKVSAGFDTGAVSLDGAGFWNMTTYGIRFLTLARCIGAGGIQL